LLAVAGGNADDGSTPVLAFPSRRQAIQEITEYIEVFYNRQRLQAKLGFLSATYTKDFMLGYLQHEGCVHF